MKLFQILSIITIIFFLSSCGENHTKKITYYHIKSENPNALLATEVIATYVVNLEKEDDNALPFLQDFDSNKFIARLINKVLSGDIKAYSYLSDIQLTIDELNICCGKSIDTIIAEDINTGEFVENIVKNEFNQNEVKELVFKEEWYFDDKNFSMEKIVLSLGLVRYYYRDDDVNKENLIKTVLFTIHNDDIQNIRPDKMSEGGQEDNNHYDFTTEVKNLTVLTTKAEYIINLEKDESTLPFLEGLDTKKFINIILNKVLSGEVKAYNYFSDKLKQLSVEEIKEKFGAINDTIMVEDFETDEMLIEIIEPEICPEEIQSLVFIEEWYLDEENYMLYKKVVGIAPVREYFREDDINYEEKLKTVPFVVYFNEPHIQDS